MKLLVAVVHSDDAAACCEALAGAGLSVTRLSATGGFLGRENAALLCGVDDPRVGDAIELLRGQARARVEEMQPLAAGVNTADLLGSFAVEVEVGGATVFVLDVARFERL